MKKNIFSKSKFIRFKIGFKISQLSLFLELYRNSLFLYLIPKFLYLHNLWFYFNVIISLYESLVSEDNIYLLIKT